MKSIKKFSLNKVFLSALLVLVVLNVFGTISENALILQSTKPLFVPVFLIFFFIKNKTIGIPFVLFLTYSFLGDSAFILFSKDMFIKASSVMYFLGYLCLIGFMVPKFRLVEFNKVIALYLVFMVFVNVYFLYTIYGVLKTIIPDSLEVLLFGMKSISLVVLFIVAFGIYLNSETRLSILFLIMALSFVFSDILNYVSQYYIYHWSFLMLDRILHAIGLFFLFNCIVEHNNTPKTVYSKAEKISIKKLLV